MLLLQPPTVELTSVFDELDVDETLEPVCCGFVACCCCCCCACVCLDDRSFVDDFGPRLLRNRKNLDVILLY